MVDWSNYSDIAKLIHCPEANVLKYWPNVMNHAKRIMIDTDECYIAFLATIAVETAHTFKPIHEYGSKDYFIKHYDNRKDLGNTEPGDGYKYAGRGFVQITGKLNYEYYGKLLGVDLVDDPNDPNDNNDPDKAMDGDVAAAILVAYFHNKHIDVAAGNKDWKLVRRRVNGGLNGLDDFMKSVRALGGL